MNLKHDHRIIAYKTKLKIPTEEYESYQINQPISKTDGRRPEIMTNRNIHRPTDQPTDGHKGSQGRYTSNKAVSFNIFYGGMMRQLGGGTRDGDGGGGAIVV